MGGNKARTRKRTSRRPRMLNLLQRDISRLQSGIIKIGMLPADPPPLRRASPVSGTISFYLKQYYGWTSDKPAPSQSLGTGSFREPGYIVVIPTESGMTFHKGIVAGIVEGMIYTQLLGIDVGCINTDGFRYMIHKISVWGALTTSTIGLSIDPFTTMGTSAPISAIDSAAKTRWPRLSWTNPRSHWIENASGLEHKIAHIMIDMPPYTKESDDLWNPIVPPEETQILVRVSVTCTTAAASYTKGSVCPSIRDYGPDDDVTSEELNALREDQKIQVQGRLNVHGTKGRTG